MNYLDILKFGFYVVGLDASMSRSEYLALFSLFHQVKSLDLSPHLVKMLSMDEIGRKRARGGLGVDEVHRTASFHRRQWRSVELESEQPGGSRAAVIGAKGRGGCGAYVEANGGCKG